MNGPRLGAARDAPSASASGSGTRVSDRDLLEALVWVPSVTGSEAEAVRFMQEQARRDGLRVIEDDVGNFIAEAGEGPRLLLFVGHIDTVPGHIPVRTQAGELWGRGSVDAKGPLAAAYCAARRHVGSQDVRIRVVGAIDEEGDSRGAKALDRSARPDWIVVGEPSGVHGITIAYKGILRGSFRLERARTHGAHPGATAVEQAIAFWREVGRRYDLQDRFDANQGHLTALTTESDGLTDRVVGRFHIRLPPGSDPDEMHRGLAQMAEAHGITLEGAERMRAAESSKRTPLVAAFLSAIRQQGGEPRFLRKTGTADFNHLAQWFPGVPMVAYGPGDAALDHTPEERIRLTEFDQAVDIFDAVIAAFARPPTQHARA